VNATRWVSTSVAVVAFVGAMGTSASAAQKKEDMILAELRQIQAQLSQLQTSHAALKAALDDLNARADEQTSSWTKTLADSKLALEELHEDLSVLSARVDETNGRIGNLREEVASLRQAQQPLIVADAEPEEEAQADDGGADEAESQEEAAPVVVTGGVSVTDIYNQARIDYTQGRYPLAISGFKEVLDIDPRGDLADNAHYWMGEAYIAQRQYDRALEEFDTVIRDYPESNKRPDAYLKKAMTLEFMDRRSEAMLMYELVIEQFPRSPQQRVARRKLEEIMRTTRPVP
jgi:tol-pal system protein YbgF